ncbi:hemicentin-1-like isoform X4 [Bolinopsis microptera]|uniref:hemicentin-1-like isoform X4 n=1 Tax=Bolinopsis microptera TaxID=2820187 RepID=UPI00307AFBA7
MLLRLSLLVLCIGGVIAKPHRSVGMKNLILPSGEKDKPNMLFTKEPRPSTMTTLGSSVTLSCAGTSSLPTGEPSVSWLFTPKITPDIKLWEGLVGGTSGTLILGNLQKSEGGYYFCQITDGYGYSLISRGALVIVTYLDPDFGAYPEEKTITESKAYIKVPCQPPASNPPAKINWYKDGKLIEKVENMIQEYVSPNKYGSLIIFNPRTSDSGMYACEASNINANPEKRKTSEVLIDIKVEGSGTYAQKFVQDHDVLVNKGEDAVLHAGAIGFPVPSYRWTLGVSVEIDVNPGSRFSTADFGRDLRISGVRTEDRGTYWCQYKNVYTDSVAVVRLYVKEDISFNTVLTEQTVEHLTPLTFDCQCSGTPYTSGDPTAPPSVLWLRDGQPIVDGKRFKEEDGSLVMSGLEMSEAGMYQCFCYNTMQISQTYMPVSVKNMTIPVSIDGNDRAEGVYNENIQILCRANGYPLPVVTWYKDNEEITAVFDPRYSITQENFKDHVLSNLRVLSVKDADAGILTCRAVNQKVSTFAAELKIDFLVGHEISPSISLSDISIQVDSSIVFEAVAYGYPTPAVTWYKGADRVPLLTGGRYTVAESSLLIDGAQSSDTGLYVVKANNGVGAPAYANATISLGVNNAMIYGSASGGVALILIIAILVLLYVLIKQKEKKNYVPPKAAPTPTEKEIERRDSRPSSAKSKTSGADKKPKTVENDVTMIINDVSDGAKQAAPLEFDNDMPNGNHGNNDMVMQGPGMVMEQPVPATFLSDLPSRPTENSADMPGVVVEQPVPVTLFPNMPREPDSSPSSTSPSEDDSDSTSYGSSTKIVKKVKKSKVGPS